jgi:hypothetical protein
VIRQAVKTFGGKKVDSISRRTSFRGSPSIYEVQIDFTSLKMSEGFGLEGPRAPENRPILQPQ